MTPEKAIRVGVGLIKKTATHLCFLKKLLVHVGFFQSSAYVNTAKLLYAEKILQLKWDKIKVANNPKSQI